MAKEVKLPKGKEYTFRPPEQQRGVYPWDEWFSGKLLILERDQGDVKGDYSVPTATMPAKLKAAASRRYKVCEVSRLDVDGARLVDSLMIRARDMTPDERKVEDAARAREKAAGNGKKS